MEQWERGSGTLYRSFGCFCFFLLSMYTRSLYATNEIIVHLLESWAAWVGVTVLGLSSIVADVLRNGVLVRIAHDIYSDTSPASCFDVDDMFAVAIEGLELSDRNS